MEYRVVIRKSDNRVHTGTCDYPETYTSFNEDVYYMVKGTFENGYQRLLDAGVDISQDEYDAMVEQAKIDLA